MRGMFPRAWAALAVVVVAVGCDQMFVPTPEEGLLGTWVWIESSGGFAGTTRTPETTGESMGLVFPDTGTVQFFRNGELVTSTTFRIHVTEEVEGGRILSIVYDESPFGFDSQTVELTGDTLALTDPCCDGFRHAFLRLP